MRNDPDDPEYLGHVMVGYSEAGNAVGKIPKEAIDALLDETDEQTWTALVWRVPEGVLLTTPRPPAWGEQDGGGDGDESDAPPVPGRKRAAGGDDG